MLPAINVLGHTIPVSIMSMLGINNISLFCVWLEHCARHVKMHTFNAVTLAVMPNK